MPHHDDEYDDDDLARRGDDEPRRRQRRDDDHEPPSRRRKGTNPTLIIILVVGLCLVVCGTPICIGLLLPAVQSVRQAAQRTKSSNNLRQISLAAHSYHDKHRELPANTYGPDGKPQLSWRVHILPFIGQDALYNQFKLDEPWDSLNNRPLLVQMPAIYASPAKQEGTKTYYRGFSSPGTMFEKRPGRNHLGLPLGGPLVGARDLGPMTLSAIKDQPNETIMIVEAGEAVEWTKPDDLDASAGKPFPPLGGMQWRGNRFHAAFADGTVRLLRADLPENTLRALISHSGGETLSPGWAD